jgi:transglutaminase-like putative cysteine protease
LRPRQALWLLLAAVAALAPLAPHLPLWITAVTALLLSWRAAQWWRSAALPPRWLLVLLALCVVAGVFLSYRNVLGREPGVALLVLFLALKLLEAKRHRDALAAIFLSYFLQLALFFESQSPAIATFTLAALIVITAALVVLSHDGHAWRAAVRRAAVMLAQALPFMLVLFVLFPRVQGPLWGMPVDAYSGLTGLSDTMSPGSISQLSLSGATAFRAKFDGEAPPSRQRYWRGPVLTRFDGRTWTATATRVSTRLPYAPAGAAVDYTVTLEPHNKAWLFALDLPGTVPPDAAVAGDFQVLANTPIRNRVRYAMRSFPQLAAGKDEAPTTLQAARLLPPGGEPRARALAAQWRAEDSAPAALSARALAYFRRQPFVYTLSPPLLGKNGIDQFLFDTRRGFCEHYAAAYVFLMRVAGIPARIVTGYQGGETNPVDDYLVVRQSDAHAWAEIWIEGQGWLRVDPTAAVAPSRIERGMAYAVPSGDPLPVLLRAEFDWLRALRFRWDAASNAWNQWVLGYNPQRQRELLTSFGIINPDWQSMTVLLSVASGAIMLVLVAWALRQRRAGDPLTRAWEKLSRKLAAAGLHRLGWEGPMDYANRVSLAKPRLGAEVQDIARLYAQLRYGHPPHARRISALTRSIRRLRP